MPRARPLCTHPSPAAGWRSPRRGRWTSQSAGLRQQRQGREAERLATLGVCSAPLEARWPSDTVPSPAPEPVGAPRQASGAPVCWGPGTRTFRSAPASASTRSMARLAASLRCLLGGCKEGPQPAADDSDSVRKQWLCLRFGWPGGQAAAPQSMGLVARACMNSSCATVTPSALRASTSAPASTSARSAPTLQAGRWARAMGGGMHGDRQRCACHPAGLSRRQAGHPNALLPRPPGQIRAGVQGRDAVLAGHRLAGVGARQQKPAHHVRLAVAHQRLGGRCAGGAGGGRDR